MESPLWLPSLFHSLSSTDIIRNRELKVPQPSKWTFFPSLPPLHSLLLCCCRWWGRRWKEKKLKEFKLSPSLPRQCVYFYYTTTLHHVSNGWTDSRNGKFHFIIFVFWIAPARERRRDLWDMIYEDTLSYVRYVLCVVQGQRGTNDSWNEGSSGARKRVKLWASAQSSMANWETAPLLSYTSWHVAANFRLSKCNYFVQQQAFSRSLMNCEVMNSYE
jgi:hypothetical protein